ncbi:MAG: hypothetical protein V3U19_02215 [Thermodesulfobacteriota bacterium]
MSSSNTISDVAMELDAIHEPTTSIENLHEKELLHEIIKRLGDSNSIIVDKDFTKKKVRKQYLKDDFVILKESIIEAEKLVSKSRSLPYENAMTDFDKFLNQARSFWNIESMFIKIKLEDSIAEIRSRTEFIFLSIAVVGVLISLTTGVYHGFNVHLFENIKWLLWPFIIINLVILLIAGYGYLPAFFDQFF